ncbi:MAG: stage II sporulation protein E [bacterium]|nr:stage II sporulation protein E [bacterium]
MRSEVAMKSINKRAICIDLLAVVVSRAVLYSMNPVAVAYFAAAFLEKSMRYLVLVATLVGMALWMPIRTAIVYGSIILLITVVTLWVEKRQKRISPYVVGIIATIITIAVNAASSIQLGIKQRELILIGVEGILVFALFVIFLKAFSYLLYCQKGQVPGNEELISLVVMIAILVYAMPTIKNVDYSIEETVAYLLILIMGYKYGAGSGAICGAACGIVLCVQNGADQIATTNTIIGIMCILGICAGIFRKVGRIGSGIAFVVANIALGYFYEKNLMEVAAVRALASATAIFLLMPRKIMYPVELTKMPEEEDVVQGKVKEAVQCKLNDFADSFKTLSKTFYGISDTKSSLSKNDVDYIFDELSDKLCKSCKNCNACWKNNFYDTYKAAFTILSAAEKRGEVRKEDVPAQFARKCIKLNDFLYETNRGLEMAKINLTWHNRLAQSREAIAGQLGEVASIIEDFSVDLYDGIDVEDGQEEKIIQYMKENHLDVRSVTILERKNKKQEFYLMARTRNGRCVTMREAATYLSQVLGKRIRPMEGSKNIVSKEFDMIVFVEDVNFKALTGVARVPQQNETISGDNYSVIRLNNGEMIMTLSDGMGTGEQACEESQSVIELLEQFMEAGFREESAIKLINSILVLRADQQTCSTIDMGIIDLFTGMCNFIKVGAAATFIKRGDFVETITSTSLPVGVLNQVDIEGINKKLYDGDVIIMITDGVLDCIKEEEKEKAFSDYILKIKTKNPQEIADDLLEYAKEQNDYVAADDMTIIVAGIWKK